jgi:hypothetical protein
MPHLCAGVLYLPCPFISTNVRLLLAPTPVSAGQAEAQQADYRDMDFQHNCSFCGWSRPSATVVMLAPSCARCGCSLDATAAPAAAHAMAPAWSLSPTAMIALKRAGVLLAVLALYAAAKLGYDAAGAAGSLIAFGAGGFLLLPFVPERLD